MVVHDLAKILFSVLDEHNFIKTRRMSLVIRKNL